MNDQPIDKPTSLKVALRYYWRRLVPPIDKKRRGEVQVSLRNASHPSFDFFLLTILSSTIATFGLLIDSPATIIGAMLVAPLMSPIIGLGLASIRGDDTLLRDAVAALLRGALLAVLISFILAWINGKLPFVEILSEQLPVEVLARTKPSPIDLGIALAGGMAAAYAIAMPNISAALPGVAIATALMPPLCTVGFGIAVGRWDVAGGASLLFITNAVTITFASMLVFVALGFSLRSVEKAGMLFNLPRSLVVSAAVTIILLVPLSFLSIQFVRDASDLHGKTLMHEEIRNVVSEEVENLGTAELADLDIVDEDTLKLVITIRTTRLLSYSTGEQLQNAVINRLGHLPKPIELLINQVFIINLDPKIPPTYTTTPTLTLTPTPGPSPTATSTDTPAPTSTATPSLTPTYTPSPTATTKPTYTPTPYKASVEIGVLPNLQLKQSPGGPVIANLSVGDIVTVLYGLEIIDGIVWVEVMDVDGRIGWVPQVYLSTPEPSP